MFYNFSKITLDFRIFSCIKKLIYFQKIFGSPIYPINYLQSLIYPLTVDLGCSATSNETTVQGVGTNDFKNWKVKNMVL